MAKTNAIRAGRAYVELFADNSKLVRGLRAAEKKLRAFGSSVRNLGTRMIALGTAISVPMIAAARTFSQFGDQVAKMAKRTGLSVETLSELRYVASQTGTEFESLEMAFRKMQRSIYDAGRGLSTAVDALTDLGLTFEDLDGLSPEEQFKLLAERISQIEDPTTRAAIAMSLFGRTGTNLLPMFEQGAAGIEALQKEARKLGLTMSSEDAVAAEEFTDALDRLWKVLKMSTFHIASILAPALQLISDTIARIVARINTWIKANRAIIFMIASVGAGLVAAGVTFVVFGTIISGVALLIGKIASVLGLIKVALAAIVSPMGLTIAAVTALGAALIYFSGVGGKALDWLKGKFQSLAGDIKKSIAAISQALANGDIALAGRILWLTLQVQWLRGIKFLSKYWVNFKQKFLQIAFDAFYGMQAAWEVSVHGLVTAMIEAVAGLKKAWSTFTSWHQILIEKTANWIARKWFWLQSLFDDSIDMEFVTKSLDDQTKQRIEEIENEKTRAIRDAQEKRDQLRDAAQEEHDQNLEDLARKYQKRMDDLQHDYEKQIQETKDQLEKARNQWQQAIAAAKEGDDASNEIQNRMFDIGDFLNQQAQKISIAGTFQSVQLAGLGAGSALDRTALACEQTARNTKRLLDETKNNNATFS